MDSITSGSGNLGPVAELVELIVLNVERDGAEAGLLDGGVLGPDARPGRGEVSPVGEVRAHRIQVSAEERQPEALS